MTAMPTMAENSPASVVAEVILKLQQMEKSIEIYSR
jgi:hypothetical protein